MIANRTHALELGGNFNEVLDAVERELLDRSRTPWVRGFLPVLAFIDGPRRVATDPGLAKLLAEARPDRRVILSLKWNLATTNRRVPAPDSETERAWFAWVDELLTTAAARVDIFVLANEPMIDTLKEDLAPGADGVVPFVRFTERLLAHVAARNDKGHDGGPLPLYVGAFTRLQAEAMQKSPAVLGLLELAARDRRVAGVDVHLHNRNLEEPAAALDFMRQRTDKPAIVTEFSLVWRHKAALTQPIGKSDAGRAFATSRQLDPAMRVIDYLNVVGAAPIAQEEWHAFLASQPWFMPDYMNQIAGIMQARGVTVATFAFSQGTEAVVAARRARKTKITLEQPPYVLNPLFVRWFCQPPAPGVPPVNYGVYDEYMRWNSEALAQRGAGVQAAR